MKALRFDYIYISSQVFLEIHKEAAWKPGCVDGLDIHEQVDVTIRSCFATGKRAKDANIPSAMLRADAQDALAFIR